MTATNQPINPRSSIEHLVIRGKRVRGDLADRITGAHVSLSAPLQGGAFSVSVLTLQVHDPDLTVWDTHLLDLGATVDLGTFYGRVTDAIVRESGAGTEIAVTAMSEGASILLDERGGQQWSNTSPSQLAVQLGESANMLVVAQPSQPPDLPLFRTEPDVTVPGDRGESSWDMLTRYGKGLGFVLFEAFGVLYYGQPSWLADSQQRLRVAWNPNKPPDDLLQMPTCHRTKDSYGRDVRELTLRVTAQMASTMRPGMALDFTGIERFAHRYLVTSVEFDIDDSAEGTITAVLPTNPLITPADAAAVAGSGAADGGGTAFGKFVNAISDQEGGVYLAVQARTGALGRYQVKPSNVGPWSKKILGRTITTDEFLHNPDLQDAIALAVLWSYYIGHGPRGAAATWYGGSPRKQNDYNRDPRYPNELSVGEYCDQVLDKMKTASGVLPSAYNGPGSSTPSVVSAKKSATQFLYYAQSQVDDHTPYRMGAKAADTVLDPQALDCSGLTAWAAGRCGVDLPDGTHAQLAFCMRHQTTVNIGKALMTPGALLFIFGVGTDTGGGAHHVAISLGDGKRTIEAAGLPTKKRRYGIVDGSSVNRGWTNAALVPGLDYP